MDALLLFHGAGSDCEAPLLAAVADAFAARGVVVRRENLPFRRARKSGPPVAGDRERDVAGVRDAVARLRDDFGPARLFLGGHSYGGRVATLAAAADPALCDALLLLAYPLHPPRKPAELRTAHFSALRTPCFFASGSRDPFGSPAEFAAALGALDVPRELLVFEGAGHDLAIRRRAAGAADAASGEAAPMVDGPHATAARETAAGFLAFVASSVR